MTVNQRFPSGPSQMACGAGVAPAAYSVIEVVIALAVPVAASGRITANTTMIKTSVNATDVLLGLFMPTPFSMGPASDRRDLFLKRGNSRVPYRPEFYPTFSIVTLFQVDKRGPRHRPLRRAAPGLQLTNLSPGHEEGAIIAFLMRKSPMQTGCDLPSPGPWNPRDLRPGCASLSG